MRGFYFKFILGLILVAIFLHFFARTTRGILTLINGTQAAQTHPQPISESQSRLSLFTQLFQQAKRTFSRAKTLPQKTTRRVLSPLQTGLIKINQAQPSFMYIIPEEPPVLLNPNLNEQDLASLTNLLAKKRAENTALAHEIGALFGQQAEHQAIVILTTAENNSYQNASTCRDLKQYLRRQKRINAQVHSQLNHLFEIHKHSFNYKAHSGSSDWNLFYQRVNDFRRAGD